MDFSNDLICKQKIKKILNNINYGYFHFKNIHQTNMVINSYG